MEGERTTIEIRKNTILMLFFTFLCLLSVKSYSQDQTIAGILNIGYDTGAEIGKGNIINFLGVQYNTDVMSLFRFNRAINSSDLRVNIGDDFGSPNDRFVVGVTDWADNLYKPFFIVHADGKVAIGTEVIREERLSVNGKIRATEVKVENSNWPDYVFLPNYKKMSLYATENFIKQNNHLPGIPSAAEVKANGIDLGDMNAKLLQKVEELTLHLIEQQKILDKQGELLKKLIKE